MKTFFTKLAFTTLLLVVLPTHAITISLNPVTPSTIVGASVDVALVISGLGSGVAPSLGTFDIDVAFNQANLSFSSVVFGSFLGDPSLGESINSFNGSTPGIVNLYELSLLEGNSTTCFFCIPPYLDNLQPASFTLATLTFNALSAGISPLDIALNAIGDANGEPLIVESVNASVTVGPNNTLDSVPEPAIWMLLGLSALIINTFTLRLSKINT